MKLRFLIGLAGLLVTRCPVLGAGMPSEAAPLFTRIGDPVSIQAEISDHAMFVHIMVNGVGPFRVIVDTGCSITVVSPELAKAARAIVQDPAEGSVVAGNALGDPTEVQRVMLDSLDLGGAHFEGVPAVVSDSLDQFSAIEGRRVDGLLGFPLFADLFLGLDFPHQRVLLGRGWPADAPVIRASLPVVGHAGVPFVQAQIQGIPIEVMIDTGANQALHLPFELAASLQSENKVWLCGADSGPILPTAERTDGLSLYPDPSGWRIAGVIPGSPADEAHLVAGDLVTQVEGRPALGWTRDQMQQRIESHPDIALVVVTQSGERALTLRAWNLVP